MRTAIMEIRGSLPPIPTPFDEHEGFAPEKFWANIQRWNICGFSGYVVLGSNGEFVHLTENERHNALEVARDAIPPHLLMVAGCSLLSTSETILYLKKAARLGADAALVNAPFYYKPGMTQARLVAHFHKVADESPIPIILYNVPQFSGVIIPVDAVVQLADHPNIIGIKDSSGDLGFLSSILRLAPSTFSVLVGSASVYFAGLTLGACGAILAVSSAAWEVCNDIFDAVQSQDYAKAKDLQLRLQPLAAAVTTQFGIAGLKAAIELRGFYGGAPRSPLTPLTEEGRTGISEIFRTSGLIPDLGP